MLSRVIIFSGKGGTGKTTISAATAGLLAQQGKRVLVMSSDPAHSLGDVVCQKLDRIKTTKLAENLHALELDTAYEARRSMSGLQNYMENAYKKQGVASSVASELAVQPGLDEILVFNRVLEEAESGNWDVVIVDTAPTGNTLRLLAYPELIVGGSSAANLIKAYKGISKFTKTFADDATRENYFNQVSLLIDILRKLGRFILSKEVSVRLVMNAEKLSIEETKRAYTFLSLYGIALDSVIVNKLYPKSDSDVAGILGIGDGKDVEQTIELGPYFDKWVTLQQHHLENIESSFSPLPTIKVYLQRNEPLGVDKLAKLGALLYGKYDAAARLNEQRVIWVEDVKEKSKKNSSKVLQRQLCLRLPFIDESSQAIEVERDGPDVTIHFGRLQRKVSLPRILNDAEFVGGFYEDGILRLGFNQEATLTDSSRSKPVLSKVGADFEDDPFKVD